MKQQGIIIGAIFAVCVIVGYFILSGDEEPLPIYNPGELNPDLVDESLQKQYEGHTLLDFNLTDQLGRTTTLNNLKGKIVIADFFFTTCPTICPKMTAQLERVQDAIAERDDVLIVSHTVTPQIDSVEVLKAYADKHGADADKWIFLTGDQEEIFRLARKSYFAVLPGSSGAETGFVHTQNFVLADEQGRLRGFYDGTNTQDVDRLIADIGRLVEE